MRKIFFSDNPRSVMVRDSQSLIELAEEGLVQVVLEALHADLVVVGSEIEYHAHHHKHEARTIVFISDNPETVGVNTFVGNTSDTIHFICTIARSTERES